jgi:hypothetical protein
VSNPPVTTDITQTGDVLGHLPAKLTFDYAIAVDDLRYLAKLIFGELVRLGGFFDPGFLQYLPRRTQTDTDNISQCNQYGLVVGNINTDYTRHISSFSFLVYSFKIDPDNSKLTLTLFVSRVCTDHSHDAFAANDLAILTNTFYRTSYFHKYHLFSWLTFKTEIHHKLQLIPQHDSAPVQIIRRHFNNYRVSGKNTNKVHSHFTGNMRQNLVTVFKLYPEHGIG